MICAIFVGDEPSKLNISTDIAFAGAKCFPRLIEWIKFLNPDYYICLNSDTISQLSDIRKLQNRGFKVIALGLKASKRLKEIPHARLLHPSGANRLINDKLYVENELNRIYNYIRSI